MARSKQEVISEMVDSGLFSDDEIRQAANQAPQQQPQRGMMGKAWDALKIPEQMASSGLDQIMHGDPDMANEFLSLAGPAVGIPAQMAKKGIEGFRSLPTETGNLPYDVVRGAPKVIGETFAETAPAFVNRASLATQGVLSGLKAAKPVIKPIVQGFGSQGESLSGAMPGSLEGAYKDSGLMFGKGRKAASEAYEAAKAGEKIEYGTSLTPARKFFNNAYAKAQSGTLKPIEALEARKVADELYDSGSFVGDEIMTKRKVFDKIAKESFAAADTGFKRALQSESLRNLLPQNKYGGTSGFKIALMTALKQMGSVGKAASMAFSPAVQGVAATGAGIASRQGPPVAKILAAALSMRRNQNAR